MIALISESGLYNSAVGMVTLDFISCSFLASQASSNSILVSNRFDWDKNWSRLSIS